MMQMDGTNNACGCNKEADVRAKIASQLQYEMMPLCVCERCGNLAEGALIRRAIEIVLRGH